MTAAGLGLFIRSHWRTLLALVPSIVAALVIFVLVGQRDSARLERDVAMAQVRTDTANMEAFAARAEAAAADFRRRYAELTVRIERAQNQVNEEVSDAYEARISDLNRRADAERLRRGQDAAAPAGRGGAATGAMSGNAAPAGGPDSTSGADRLPLDDAVLCSAQAIQLDELIDWIERQLAIDRAPPDAGS